MCPLGAALCPRYTRGIFQPPAGLFVGWRISFDRTQLACFVTPPPYQLEKRPPLLRRGGRFSGWWGLSPLWSPVPGSLRFSRHRTPERFTLRTPDGLAELALCVRQKKNSAQMSTSLATLGNLACAKTSGLPSPLTPVAPSPCPSSGGRARFFTSQGRENSFVVFPTLLGDSPFRSPSPPGRFALWVRWRARHRRLGVASCSGRRRLR